MLARFGRSLARLARPSFAPLAYSSSTIASDSASLRAAGAVAVASALAVAIYTVEEQRRASCEPWLGKDVSLVMAGDCGGTNSRLQIFKVPNDAKLVVGQPPPGELLFAKKYENHEFSNFTVVCQRFLEDAAMYTGGIVPAACCLACAGAISENSVEFTNVASGWNIHGAKLERELGIKRVVLINDFVAQGYGLLTLSDDEKVLLNKGTYVPGAPVACVGAGTGLGECFLTAASDGTYTCWPSEGGHVEFSPRNELGLDLLHHLREKFADKKRVSIERVVSGPGIASIYEFLRGHWAFSGRVDPAIDQAFVDAPPHKQAVVVSKGAAAKDAVCEEAIDLFSECYGAEVGNAVLKWLPKGGMYVSGGIAAKNPDWIKSETFLAAYHSKGRLSPQLAQTPLFLVLTEDTGERGALYCAVQTLLGTFA